MQNSLVEIFGIDVNSTYQQGFVYIRQLAIHLRNAIIQRKKVKKNLLRVGWHLHHHKFLQFIRHASIFLSGFLSICIQLAVYSLSPTVVSCFKWNSQQAYLGTFNLSFSSSNSRSTKVETLHLWLLLNVFITVQLTWLFSQVEPYIKILSFEISLHSNT